jgi:small subunit ribosomal protein S20
MANHPSAAKRHRQAVQRTQRNLGARSRVRSAVKKVRVVAETGGAEAARVELKSAARILQKAASKGIVHRNNASRRISRLARLVNSLEGRPSTSGS